MRQRRETVEHPFGTLKMRMGATHFLMKRLPKVATEMALHVLAYNLTRVMNIMGRVRINDRGPFVRGRVIDVTPAAAHDLGFSGLTNVVLTVVGRTRPNAPRKRHHRTHQAAACPPLACRVSYDALDEHQHEDGQGARPYCATIVRADEVID
jgi:hypothetical protein